MKEFINSENKNFVLLNDVQTFSFTVGNAYRLGVVFKDKVADDTFRNVSYICDELETNNNGIVFHNLSHNGRDNVDLIIEVNRDNKCHLIKVGKANSLTFEDLQKEVDYRKEHNNNIESSPFITALHKCSLENLYDLSQDLNNSDLEEAVNNFRDFEDFYSGLDSKELLNFIKYNDVSKYQENHNVLLDIRNEAFVLQTDAVNEIVDDLGEDIFDALKEAFENGEISLGDIDYDLKDAFEETVSAEQQEFKQTQSKSRKI